MHSNNMNPKVFASHASEDKERFVLDFATKLRSKGIDTWVDRWEINPGDSLVDKIFEEGIKNAQAVIVVLSKYSVDKPWVREELNASVVKKINENIKLIPVVIDIDDCRVPECLRSTYWQKIADLQNYDSELDSIVRSIYGQYEKPPIGEPPAYTQTIVDIIPNLTKIDSLVLKLSCENAIENDYPFIDADDILPQAKSLDIDEENFSDTLQILYEGGYIEDRFGANFKITVYGFEEYARTYIKDYDSIIRSVALQIINSGRTDNESILAVLDQPMMIINHVLEFLDSQGYFELHKWASGKYTITNISPKLKRWLNQT